MERTEPFKTCTLCTHCWCELESFLEDRQLRLEGYQASFATPEHGLLLFTHDIDDCGTTISVRAGLLKDLVAEEGNEVRNTGQATCPGHCLDPGNLEPCEASCSMHWVRELIQGLKNRSLTVHNLEKRDNGRTVLLTPTLPERGNPMMTLDWKPAYSVGIPTFDDQHKKLFAVVNKMGAAIEKGADHDTLRGIFKELIEYTRIHFRDEEANLLLYDYPNYQDHKVEHDELVAQVVDFALDFCANPDMTYKVMTFLESWIIGHILGTDKGYTDFLAGKEIIEWE